MGDGWTKHSSSGMEHVHVVEVAAKHAAVCYRVSHTEFQTKRSKLRLDGGPSQG